MTSVELPDLTAAPGRQTVIAVNDPTGVTRRLLPVRFTNLADGRLGVLARPGMRRPSWLASDLLTTLGCRDDVTGAGRPGEGSLDLAAVWLTVHNIRDLYVRHAWTLPARVISDLMAATASVPVRLWLVGDTPYTPDHENATGVPADDALTGPGFLDIWHHLPQPVDTASPASATEESGWPDRLPSDDFVTFRAACRTHLTPQQFELVDTHLRAAHTDAADRIQALVECDGVTASALAAWLEEVWQNTAWMSQFIAYTRATQIAFFSAGWQLKVDLPRFLATASTTPRRALRTPKVWNRLRAYPEPHRGAICALAAAGLTSEQIVHVRLHDLDPGGRKVCVDGNWVEVEKDARLFLRAQRERRCREGSRTTALLFVTNRGTKIRSRTVGDTITLARRELGVAFPAPRGARKAPTGDRWTQQWGLGLWRLR